jgi:hypothetical protein
VDKNSERVDPPAALVVEYESSAVLERVSWQLAYRDDAWGGQALYEGVEIEEMHDTPPEVGMMAVLEQVHFPGVHRVLVPTVPFVLLYLLKVLCGAHL